MEGVHSRLVLLQVIFVSPIDPIYAEYAEEADSQETLEFDDEQYPQLPDNVLELRLHRRKAFLRQFMAAVRCMYCPIQFRSIWANYYDTGYYELTGRIPWGDIAENPSHYLSKRSRPDTDYKLEDPSHMKSKAVDAWLQHWLKMQRKDRRPLVLKDGSNKPSELADPPIVSRRKGKQSKARYIEAGDDNEEKEVTVVSLPTSPHSVAPTPMRRRIFLASLSDDEHYKRLLLLLRAAKVSNMLLVSALTDKLIGW